MADAEHHGQDGLKVIISQATQLCRNEGVKADLLELAYIATLAQQQHKQQQPPLSNQQLAAITAEGVLRPVDAGWQATVRLQVAMERAYHQQQQQWEEQRGSQLARTQAAAAAVLRIRPSPAGSIEEYEAAALKLLDYLGAAGAQLGEGPDARAEMAAALESVCGLTGVARLLTLTPAERQQQIEALVQLVTGVVLFNASRSRPGSALATTPQLLGASAAIQQGHALLRQLQAAATECRQAHAWVTRVSAEACSARGVGSSTLRASAAGTIAAAGARRSSGGGGVGVGLPCGGAVVLCCQAWAYLAAMAGDLEGGLAAAEALQAQLSNGLAQVSQLVGASAAVPKDAAFPLLEQLGAAQAALREELQLLLQRQRLWEALVNALTAVTSTPAAAAGGVVNPVQFRAPPGMGGRILAASRPEGPPPAALVASLPEPLQYIPHLPGASSAGGGGSEEEGGLSWEEAQGWPVALGGLCPVSLARFAEAARGKSSTQGGGAAGGGVVARGVVDGLAPADPSLGGIRVGSCVYGFASASHLSAFLTDHSNILAAATAAAEAQPLLRHLLHLQHYQQQQEEEAAAAAAEAAAQAAAAEGEGAAPAAGGDASTSGSAAEDAAEAAPVGDADAAAKEKEEEQAALLAAAEAEAAAAAAAAVPPIPGLRELLVGLQSLLLKVDAGTQTPTHFVEKHLDYSYEWNEWALRKRLLALTNLTHKATHSTQTALSHFRREGESQVWLPKPAVTQTPVNKASSMPRTLRYVTGLRGPPEVKMKVVSLQLDLGQPHQH